MLNPYTPFPRYENAVFVGDTAVEALAQLHIYARGLIGGDIPSMEVLHPTEKLLECTHCAIKRRPQILDAAARRINADYILLEDNGLEDLNPAVMAEPLKKEGFKVITLDVQGTPEEVLVRAAAMFSEKRQAERVLNDMKTRLSRLKELPALPKRRVLPVLGIRHPVENSVYAFAAADDSDLAGLVLDPLGLSCALHSKENKVLPGLVDPTLGCGWSSLLSDADPDVIALCGDGAAALAVLLKNLHGKMPDAPVVPLPWYCRSMGCRIARTLEIWDGAFRAMSNNA